MAKVLVVDDEPDLRFLHRRILVRAGHDVSEACDGAAALESVRESPPDLVVTDVMMPVMGGIEFIQRLRADPSTEAIPVLAISGDWQLMTEADMEETVSFPAPIQPPSRTRFEMLLSVKEHEMHHRGQLMLIERLLGIVPHLTRQFQQRMAARQAAAAKT